MVFVVEWLLDINVAGDFLSESRNYGQYIKEKFLSKLQ